MFKLFEVWLVKLLTSSIINIFWTLTLTYVFTQWRWIKGNNHQQISIGNRMKSHSVTWRESSAKAGQVIRCKLKSSNEPFSSWKVRTLLRGLLFGWLFGQPLLYPQSLLQNGASLMVEVGDHRENQVFRSKGKINVHASNMEWWDIAKMQK